MHRIKLLSDPCRLSTFLRFKSPSSKALAATPHTPQKSTGWAPRSGVARAVAPNGQPRKIPAAILAAGESGMRAFTADEDQPDSAKSDQWTIHSSSEGDNRGIYGPVGVGVNDGR
jgi:hypothetical protein